LIPIDPYVVNIVAGAWLTLVVAFGSLAVAITLGLIGALAKLSGVFVLRAAATLYSTLVRGVPDLVLMLLIYYGGQIAINQLISAAGSEANIDVDPLTAGILTIGFIYGAYLTETFRGAILAIPRGQAEAARAFGMSRLRVVVSIITPQMIRFALPGFTNIWLVLVKATALVSIIGLTDMMYRAKQASGATQTAFTYFLAAGAVYLLITTISLWLLKGLDAHYSRGVKRANA
jgi:arginine/ornithine transport system permease protein